MNKQYLIIAAVVAVVAIAGISTYLMGKDDKDDNATTNSSGSPQTADSLVDKDSGEYKSFSELKGEDYDRTFIASMIVHHQGAVDMAKLALTNAKRQELKAMANDIISAQSKEISDMESWQKQWGYPVSSGEMMADHSAMGTMSDMAGMNDELAGLTGDDFDQAFLSSMIKHHQSAINMAYPGQTNAEHEEVKTLTKAIVDAQSKEISQLKQWQSQWDLGS